MPERIPCTNPAHGVQFHIAGTEMARLCAARSPMAGPPTSLIRPSVAPPTTPAHSENQAVSRALVSAARLVGAKNGLQHTTLDDLSFRRSDLDKADMDLYLDALYERGYMLAHDDRGNDYIVSSDGDKAVGGIVHPNGISVWSLDDPLIIPEGQNYRTQHGYYDGADFDPYLDVVERRINDEWDTHVNRGTADDTDPMPYPTQETLDRLSHKAGIPLGAIDWRSAIADAESADQVGGVLDALSVKGLFIAEHVGTGSTALIDVNHGKWTPCDIDEDGIALWNDISNEKVIRYAGHDGPRDVANAVRDRLAHLNRVWDGINPSDAGQSRNRKPPRPR